MKAINKKYGPLPIKEQDLTNNKELNVLINDNHSEYNNNSSSTKKVVKNFNTFVQSLLNRVIHGNNGSSKTICGLNFKFHGNQKRRVELFGTNLEDKITCSNCIKISKLSIESLLTNVDELAIDHLGDNKNIVYINWDFKLEVNDTLSNALLNVNANGEDEYKIQSYLLDFISSKNGEPSNPISIKTKFTKDEFIKIASDMHENCLKISNVEDIGISKFDKEVIDNYKLAMKRYTGLLVNENFEFQELINSDTERESIYSEIIDKNDKKIEFNEMCLKIGLSSLFPSRDNSIVANNVVPEHGNGIESIIEMYEEALKYYSEPFEDDLRANRNVDDDLIKMIDKLKNAKTFDLRSLIPNRSQNNPLVDYLNSLDGFQFQINYEEVIDKSNSLVIISVTETKDDAIFIMKNDSVELLEFPKSNLFQMVYLLDPHLVGKNKFDLSPGQLLKLSKTMLEISQSDDIRYSSENEAVLRINEICEKSNLSIIYEEIINENHSIAIAELLNCGEIAFFHNDNLLDIPVNSRFVKILRFIGPLISNNIFGGK